MQIENFTKPLYWVFEMRKQNTNYFYILKDYCWNVSFNIQPFNLNSERSLKKPWPLTSPTTTLMAMWRYLLMMTIKPNVLSAAVNSSNYYNIYREAKIEHPKLQILKILNICTKLLQQKESNSTIGNENLKQMLKKSIELKLQE